MQVPVVNETANNNENNKAYINTFDLRLLFQKTKRVRFARPHS